MKTKIIRYDVYDKKDRWVGSYSTDLDHPNDTSSFDMARINNRQSGGKIIARHQCGLEEEVINLKVIRK